MAIETPPAFPDSRLHRLAGGIPLYVQIAESLLDRIGSGDLAPGDRIPPERELSRSLEVNRLTVRRALRMLEAQGLVVRRQGAGTYVAEPKIERQAARLVSFTRGVQRHGLQPGARLVSIELRPLEASLARELRLPVATVAYDILRLRLINGSPALLERYFIPALRFPGLDRFDLEQRSVFEVLDREYHIPLKRARQTLEPVVAGEFEAGLLQVRPGAPLMLERRTSFDALGSPVEIGRDLYRGDRFRFVTELAPLEP
jgi:GntR family transcriptional regulator